MEIKEVICYITKEVQETLQRVDQKVVDEIIDSIIGAKKIFLYGVGRSGLVGQAFAVRLVQMGLDVHFIGEMTTPIVEEKDLVIIVSNTGETMSAIQTANIVRRVGAKVIAITSNVHSKLSQASNVTVEIAPKKDEQKKRYAPLGTLFEDSTFLFFDCIVPIIMARLGQNETSLRRRHAIWV
ncbi:MAG: SIS domain-containing protein [Methanomassiliicoccales archaeon]|nr:SIS domain-containing protein [Methanomassiliicoccales archaeon]